MAAQYARTDMCKLLIHHGADINAVNHLAGFVDSLTQFRNANFPPEQLAFWRVEGSQQTFPNQAVLLESTR